MSFARQEQARALGDPTRFEIYQYVVAAGRDVDVPELTGHTRLNHNAVRQHLAKLVAAGLLVEGREQRSRPGRPRLVYRALDAPVPAEAAYEQLASWLTEMVATGDDAENVGRRAGEQTAGPLAAADVSPVERLRLVMEAHGFAPATRRRAGETEIVLQRCPYTSAVLTDPDTICTLHLGLAAGAADRLGGVEVAELIPHDPRRAGCRLVVREVPEG